MIRKWKSLKDLKILPEDFEDEQAVDSDDMRKAEKTPEDIKVIFPTVEDLEMKNPWVVQRYA